MLRNRKKQSGKSFGGHPVAIHSCHLLQLLLELLMPIYYSLSQGIPVFLTTWTSIYLNNKE
mgnify:CR=1 FL=1